MTEANLHAFDLDDTLVPGSSTERGFWKLAEYGALRLPDETLSHLAARRIDRTLAPQQPDSNFGYDWEIVLAFVAAVKNGLAVKDLKRASKEVAEEDVENIYPVMLERVNEVKAAGDK